MGGSNSASSACGYTLVSEHWPLDPPNDYYGYSAGNYGSLTPGTVEGLTVQDLAVPPPGSDVVYLSFAGGAQIPDVTILDVTIDGVTAQLGWWAPSNHYDTGIDSPGLAAKLRTTGVDLCVEITTS